MATRRNETREAHRRWIANSGKEVGGYILRRRDGATGSMMFVVELEGELNTKDFLGKNVTRGSVLSLSQADLARPLIMEALKNGWIRELKTAKQHSSPATSRILNKSTPVIPNRTQVVDVQGINAKLEELQRTVNSLSKNELPPAVSIQLAEQTKLLATLVSQGGVSQVKAKDKEGISVIEVVSDMLPSLKSIEGSTASLEMKEKESEGVQEGVKKLRGLRSKRK